VGGQDGVRADADAWRHRYRCCNATVDRPFADERTPHLSVARDPEKAASPDHEWFAPKKQRCGQHDVAGKGGGYKAGKRHANLSGTFVSVLSRQFLGCSNAEGIKSFFYELLLIACSAVNFAPLHLLLLHNATPSARIRRVPLASWCQVPGDSNAVQQIYPIHWSAAFTQAPWSATFHTGPRVYDSRARRRNKELDDTVRDTYLLAGAQCKLLPPKCPTPAVLRALRRYSHSVVISTRSHPRLCRRISDLIKRTPLSPPLWPPETSRSL